MQLNDNELLEYINGDLPYFDLTTHLLDVPTKEVTLSILTRDTIITACTEESARVAELLGCSIKNMASSGVKLKPKDLLLEIEGGHEAIHQAWRLCQILLEHACGLATGANKMLKLAQEVNPECEIFVTRKSFPLSKRFTIRALLCGGVVPHRLGLSESVLIFSQHRALYKDEKSFKEALILLKKRCIEKKLTVESESLEDAKEMLHLGVDVLQMDKCSLEVLSEVVAYKNKNFPHASILVTGGVNSSNVAKFVQTGVDGVVTSSLYNSKMADLTSLLSNK